MSDEESMGQWNPESIPSTYNLTIPEILMNPEVASDDDTPFAPK